VELRGERVVLRALAEADVARLVDLGAAPAVARWWPGLTAEHLGEKARGEEDGVTGFAVIALGKVVGLVQYHEGDDPEYRHAGIDVFVGVPYQRRGLGTDALRTLVRHLVRDRGHHRVTIDPAADNAAAIRCYERVGFRPVGVMREYWRDVDGVWRDGLLMDLLATELTEAEAS